MATSVEFLCRKYESSNLLFSSSGNIQWEAVFKSRRLHLRLLSGAASAAVRYVVHVAFDDSDDADEYFDYSDEYDEYEKYKKYEKYDEYDEFDDSDDFDSDDSDDFDSDVSDNQVFISSGSATIKKCDSADLALFDKVYSATTFTAFIELFVCRLDRVFEIPQESTLFAVLSSSLNDVMLYFGPEKELVKASKFMLMARSPVFKNMFEASMKEAELSEVTIIDITPAVGKEMITYIYTDEAPNVRDMAEELWFAAEKYQLPGLKALCNNEIVKQLKIDNAAHFLLFAVHCCGDGGIKLKDYILSFITKDKDTCSTVMKSEEWKEVQKIPHLTFAVSDMFFGVSSHSEPRAKRAKCAKND